MLPKDNRLTQKRDFDLVLRKGRMLQTATFALGYYELAGGAPSRFGFIISTKISKLAVERNRLRRILKQNIRQLLPTVRPGFLFVILVRRTIVDKQKEFIGQELRRALKKLTVLK